MPWRRSSGASTWPWAEAAWDRRPHDDERLTSAAVEQLQWHWQNLLRPRLEGPTDEELLCDPTGDDQQAWTVHSADEQRTAHQAGAGDLVIDFDLVEGQPQPFTTISWRLGHVIVGVLAARSHSHFDGPKASYGT